MTQPILALGLDAAHERIERAAFDAPVSLADGELALLDPAALPALWSHVAPGADGKRMTNAETDGGFGYGLIELLRRRRREVAELLAAGGTLACLLRPVGSPLYVRRQTRRGPAAVIVHAYSWLPDDPALAKLVIAAAPGREPRAADPDHPAWRLIEAQGGDAAHEACVANEQLNPAWHVVATDRLGRPVAIEVAIGPGRLVFVPPVAGDADRRGELLVRCFAPEPEEQALPEPPPAAAPPEWLTENLLPGQAKVSVDLEDLAERLEQLHVELADLRARNGELCELSRLLYAASAGELAAGAAPAFRRLGFGVEPAEDDCLVLHCDEGRAIVAVAASHAAVEADPYWTLVRRFEGDPDPPAGIILGNAYCDVPPDQRDVPFSDLLRRGAEHRGLCLLASTDLHAALAALIREPGDDLRRKLRQAILTATGPCDLLSILESSDAS